MSARHTNLLFSYGKALPAGSTRRGSRRVVRPSTRRQALEAAKGHLDDIVLRPGPDTESLIRDCSFLNPNVQFWVEVRSETEVAWVTQMKRRYPAVHLLKQGEVPDGFGNTGEDPFPGILPGGNLNGSYIVAVAGKGHFGIVYLCAGAMAAAPLFALKAIPLLAA